MSANSDIIRVTTGRLNTVNDTIIAGTPAGTTTQSATAGQLGKRFEISGENIAQMFDSTVGDLFGGWYRYVRMRAADDDSPAVSVGQILFWDTTLTNWQTLYQVTRDENLSSVDNAVMIAGIYLGGFTGGNYGFICDEGLVDIGYRSVLTVAAAIGGRVYAAGTGDVGLDQGKADLLTTDSTSLANARYLGTAVELPVVSARRQVLLKLHNYLA
jgi:hypothetical protein